MKKNYIILSVLACIVGFWIYKNISEESVLQEKKTAYESMIIGIEELTQNDIASLINQEELVIDANCSYTSEVKNEGSRGYHTWDDLFCATIYVQDEFDTWPEVIQYNYIDALGDSAIELFNHCVEESFPQYIMYNNSNGDLSEIYGSLVFHHFDEEIIIKTSNNTYEYSSILDNYFLKNGKDVLIRNANGDWDSGMGGAYLQDDNGRCALSHCDRVADEGKPYCGIHVC